MDPMRYNEALGREENGGVTGSPQVSPDPVALTPDQLLQRAAARLSVVWVRGHGQRQKLPAAFVVNWPLVLVSRCRFEDL